ncbi:MAG: pyridoxamine 5'-phosphate oxidase [Polyangiales bacterium]|nr:pyridoxamine 5'-phosphate oxidase [Myxococcales bacterium]MCB9659317.1 pyridoxamine 5'-phosphate oxidase [Sandaracinaceae bacterium]
MQPQVDPVAWFRQLYADARQHEVFDADRAALATADAAGVPSVRFVLVRGADEAGFTFYTHRDSRKGRELARGVAALAYHWASTGVQVRVEGPVSEAPDDVSDAYFAGRPRGSQLGAWSSPQSQPIDSRDALDALVRETTERFDGQAVPRPPRWGGYRLVPTTIELWFNDPDRLHDRFEYTRLDASAPWRMRRLAP